MITQDVILKVFNIQVDDFSVGSLGVATTNSPSGVLTFLSEAKYLKDVNENRDVKAVFIREIQNIVLRDDIVPIYVDDPKWSFFTLLDYMGRNKSREKTKISATARIHESAVIYEEGVVIGENVLIDANVTIYPDTVIEDNVVIRAGAVIGVDGYEHKNTSKGVVSVAHDGRVIIERDVEIGVNNNISKGFSYRDTIIGEGTKFDALVHYAHGVQSGKNCRIVASCMIAGHVTLGDNVWIGPNASIANRLNIESGAFITIGSVVVKDVSAGEKVTGNFAIPHRKFIRNLKESMK